jgi:hypothetical protein
MKQQIKLQQTNANSNSSSTDSTSINPCSSPASTLPSSFDSQLEQKIKLFEEKTILYKNQLRQLNERLQLLTENTKIQT